MRTASRLASGLNAPWTRRVADQARCASLDLADGAAARRDPAARRAARRRDTRASRPTTSSAKSSGSPAARTSPRSSSAGRSGRCSLGSRGVAARMRCCGARATSTFTSSRAKTSADEPPRAGLDAPRPVARDGGSKRSGCRSSRSRPSPWSGWRSMPFCRCRTSRCSTSSRWSSAASSAAGSRRSSRRACPSSPTISSSSSRVYTFTIAKPHELFALVIFLAAAIFTGELAGRMREQAERCAPAGAGDAGALRFQPQARACGSPRQRSRRHRRASLRGDRSGHGAARAGGRASWPSARSGRPTSTLDPTDMTAARWAFDKREPAGNATGTLPQVPLAVPARSSHRARSPAFSACCGPKRRDRSCRTRSRSSAACWNRRRSPSTALG